jgi:NAD(P) transhydrogenase subunit beta
MIGMGIAILTTLALAAPSEAGSDGWALIILRHRIGGGIGAVIARGSR